MNNWTTGPWPYNSAIPFTCHILKVKNMTIYLHKEFICTDKKENNGLGFWVEGETFEFTVSPYFSGRCPDNINIEKAKVYALKSALNY
jgi:hypothetical protein